MKKLLLVGVMSIMLIALASLAFAGDYHMKDTLICSDCHIMHASQNHAYNPTTDTWFQKFTGQAEPYLLRGPINEMCLECHNGGTYAPDVLGDNTGTFTREAGGLNDASTAGTYESWMGHTLGSSDAAPGGTGYVAGTEGLTCVNCHSQHGRASGSDVAGNLVTNAYRNLNAMGGVGVSYAIATNDPTKDVFERDATLRQVATHYDIANVDFNEPNTAKSGMGQFCKGCHTDFHGGKGDANMGGDTTGAAWLRHPTAGVDIGAQTGGHSKLTTWNATGKTNFVKVMSATSNWGGTATDATPSCMSCHKAHGNKNAFGLVYMGGTGAVTEEGTAGANVKTLCKQCHSQG